ncbi:MAG: ImmA/IrrE family metallo-endopeptidase [Planctomycetaceae bacterium]|nr:ImmA/IrrE family metallo-endopeptidase [Planctomycetaceae bacterium]
MTLTKPDFDAVALLARNVLKENMISKPPVIASHIANSYGLQVFRMQFNPEYSDVSGFIDANQKAIAVNADDAPVRQNFTIAHELGHYLRNHHLEEGYSVLLRDKSHMVNTPMEVEANWFAGNLLVPEMFLREYLDTYPYATDRQLSNIFGVSAEVIRIRRQYL